MAFAVAGLDKIRWRQQVQLESDLPHEQGNHMILLCLVRGLPCDMVFARYISAAHVFSEF